ncbi:MAG: C-GCAxxG-C-C family protein [Phycisphaerae bacterium]|nr:C-GCAxxG-C-C family protein [Phycisphaerae bacterium]
MECTRRAVFGTLGVAAGSCLLSSCTRQEMRTTQEKTGSDVLPWSYHELDPETTAERAYLLHYEGHCMYGVFKSIVGQLAGQYGEPYRSFPCGMMTYGAGGVASWGSLCGALNGAAAAIALFARKKEQQAGLTNQLFFWYEQTELPVYVPAQPKLAMQMPKSLARSILCHPSVGAWCKVSGYPVAGKEHMERCARLTADTARQTVLVLNEGLSGRFSRPRIADEQVGKCNACHDRNGERKDTLAGMTCGSCHTSLSDKHPTVAAKPQGQL